MDHIQIEGIWYHARDVLDADGNPTGEMQVIYDEHGQPIISDICLCAATEHSGCCCGAWDKITHNDWDEGWNDE